jgi:outer membrane protein OmpA-like peptidoglycan-associated protein
MKDIRIAISILIGGIFAGCATTPDPTQALVRARNLQNEAVASPNIGLAEVELHDAQRILKGAELEHEANPRSNMEMHLSNIAAAKFEIAMAEAKRRGAEQRLAAARTTGDAEEQIAQLQAQLEAERQARIQLEQEMAKSLESLEGEGATVERTEEGTVLTLTGAVLFRFDEAELLPSAKEKLGQVAEALQAQGEDVEIVIEGHADATGPTAYNQDLSRRRAESVKQFLVEQGLDADRLRTIARGERDPIATNETPSGRANNRRVEIVVPGEA